LRRTGKTQIQQDEASNSQTNQSSSNNNTLDIAVVNALNRNSFLRKLRMMASCIFRKQYQNAKKLGIKSKKVNKLETNAKL
jgi:hypothetical protein